MVLVADRVVVPKVLRKEVLQILHTGHYGVSGMGMRARETMFWPRMNQDILQTRELCEMCRKIAPSQPAAPPTPLPVADYPFRYVASNYFQLEAGHYVIFVCQYSNWLSMYRAKDCTSRELVSLLRSYMGTIGVMEELSTDGATVYKSAEVNQFPTNVGVQ